MPIGIGSLIAFMMFIIWDLAKTHNAGRFGTIVLFAGLALGVFGFLAKLLIQFLLERAGS